MGGGRGDATLSTPYQENNQLNKSQSSIELRQGTASSYPSQVEGAKLKPNLTTPNADLKDDLNRN